MTGGRAVTYYITTDAHGDPVLWRDVDGTPMPVVAWASVRPGERERFFGWLAGVLGDAPTLARAYSDGYNDAATLAYCYGHTDHWPADAEPRNPYDEQALGGGSHD